MAQDAVSGDPHFWYARPVFFVADLKRALSFYLNLGFTKAWPAEDGKGPVCQVNHGECELILCEDSARPGNGRLFIELTVRGFAELRPDLAERGVASREMWWGYDSVLVEDPDRNELIFPDPRAPQADANPAND
jgi:hypothetical protein